MDFESARFNHIFHLTVVKGQLFPIEFKPEGFFFILFQMHTLKPLQHFNRTGRIRNRIPDIKLHHLIPGPGAGIPDLAGDRKRAAAFQDNHSRCAGFNDPAGQIKLHTGQAQFGPAAVASIAAIRAHCSTVSGDQVEAQARGIGKIVL